MSSSTCCRGSAACLAANGADGAVLVYVMEADDVQRALAAYGASQLPIDVAHRAVLAQVLEAPLEIAPLYECSA